jgi:putative oxidoreductase
MSYVASMIDRVDRTLVPWLRRRSVGVLRMSLGLVFVWFGALKILDVSPVADLVADTVYWVSADWFVPLLGAIEVLVGIGLAVGRGLRPVLLVLAMQMVGTFLVFVLLPEVAFQDGNPLKLTVEGEFVIKNLVLLSAGLVVGATITERQQESSAATPASAP